MTKDGRQVIITKVDYKEVPNNKLSNLDKTMDALKEKFQLVSKSKTSILILMKLENHLTEK